MYMRASQHTHATQGHGIRRSIPASSVCLSLCHYGPSLRWLQKIQMHAFRIGEREEGRVGTLSLLEIERDRKKEVEREGEGGMNPYTNHFYERESKVLRR